MNTGTWQRLTHDIAAIMTGDRRYPVVFERTDTADADDPTGPRWVLPFFGSDGSRVLMGIMVYGDEQGEATDVLALVIKDPIDPFLLARAVRVIELMCKLEPPIITVDIANTALHLVSPVGCECRDDLKPLEGKIGMDKLQEARVAALPFAEIALTKLHSARIPISREAIERELDAGRLSSNHLPFYRKTFGVRTSAEREEETARLAPAMAILSSYCRYTGTPQDSELNYTFGHFVTMLEEDKETNDVGLHLRAGTALIMAQSTITQQKGEENNPFIASLNIASTPLLCITIRELMEARAANYALFACNTGVSEGLEVSEYRDRLLDLARNASISK